MGLPNSKAQVAQSYWEAFNNYHARRRGGAPAGGRYGLAATSSSSNNNNSSSNTPYALSAFGGQSNSDQADRHDHGDHVVVSADNGSTQKPATDQEDVMPTASLLGIPAEIMCHIVRMVTNDHGPLAATIMAASLMQTARPLCAVMRAEMTWLARSAMDPDSAHWIGLVPSGCDHAWLAGFRCGSPHDGRLDKATFEARRALLVLMPALFGACSLPMTLVTASGNQDGSQLDVRLEHFMAQWYAGMTDSKEADMVWRTAYSIYCAAHNGLSSVCAAVDALAARGITPEHVCRMEITRGATMGTAVVIDGFVTGTVSACACALSAAWPAGQAHRPTPPVCRRRPNAACRRLHLQVTAPVLCLTNAGQSPVSHPSLHPAESASDPYEIGFGPAQQYDDTRYFNGPLCADNMTVLLW